jgi:hypothetical protein
MRTCHHDEPCGCLPFALHYQDTQPMEQLTEQQIAIWMDKAEAIEELIADEQEERRFKHRLFNGMIASSIILTALLAAYLW